MIILQEEEERRKLIDPEWHKPGFGIIDRFQKLKKRSDEEVKIGMFRCRSHVNYTFHKPVPADFDRSKVLLPEQMRALKEL